MAVGAGTSTAIGTGIETVYGTPVAITKRHAFVSEGLQRASTPLQSNAITGTLAGFRRAGVISRRSAAGPLNLELSKHGMGRWLQLMAGSSAAPVQEGATTAYLQTHPAGSLDRKVTLQKVIRDLAGVEVETFCVDEQTEILTQRGWITHHSLDADDVVLSFDPDTREIVWEPVISVHRFDWDGPLTRWDSKRIDALTTPSHRWLVEGPRSLKPRPGLTACPECGATSGKRGPFKKSGDVRSHMTKAHGIIDLPPRREFSYPHKPEFRTTDQLADSRELIITGGGTPACFASAPIYTDEFVELIGWTISEGHYRPGDRGVIISQSIKANPGHAERIRRLAEHFRVDGATVSEYEYGGHAVQWYFGKGIGQAIRDAAPDKQLTPTFLRALTHDQATLLFDTLIDGDGHNRREGEIVWYQKDQGRIDGFQTLAAMLGKRTWAHLSANESSVISVHRQNHSVGRNIPTRQEDYLGIVWCPRTRTGTWLARRNGCTYWTGNTYHGTICTQWEMAVSVDGIPTVNLTLDSEDEETTTTSAALLALPEPTHQPFNWTQASLTLAGVPASRVTAMSATGTNSQDVEGYFLGGGGTKSEPTLGDFRNLTGSLTAEFADPTVIYDRFAAYSAHPLVLSFIGEIIASTFNYEFTITIPEIRFSGSTPVVGGPGKVTIDGPWEAFYDGTNPVYTLKYRSTDVTV